MTRKEIQMVENVMDGWHVGYVYLYPVSGGKRREFVFDLLPENIASFIYRNRYEAAKIEVTDMLDRMILNIDAQGGEGNQNREMCERVARSLQAILDGSELVQFPIVTRELYDKYCALEEMAVMEATIAMLLREAEVC